MIQFLKWHNSYIQISIIFQGVILEEKLILVKQLFLKAFWNFLF